MGIATIIGNILTDSGAGIGSANGVATLDGSGKIPASQLPNSVMEFKGVWSASLNSPTLVNGTGNAGDVYEVISAGTVNFGAGNITFSVGDYVIYDGSEWQYSSGQKGTITSIVAGTGLTGGTITTSGTIAFDTTWGDARYQLSLTNPVTGTGTTNYLPKFTGSTMIGNSLLVDNGTNLTYNGEEFIVNKSGGSFVTLLSGTTDSQYIQFSDTGGAAGALAYNHASDYMWFKTGGSERMRLTSTGLGIGTTSPAAKLDVNGSVNISSAGNLFVSATSGIFFNGNSSYATGIYNDNSGILRFATSGSDKMRLDPSGNLGLGVTPSAWGSGRTAIQLQGSSTAVYFAGEGNTVLSNNYYYNAGDKYIANGFSTQYLQGSSGQHAWYIAPNNTSGAGAALTYTQAMTLNASGRLLLATTTDDGSSRLQVSGAATFSSSVTAGGLSSAIAKSGTGVESINLLTLQTTGTAAIGDSLNIRFVSPQFYNIANISAILGGDNTAYGSLAFSVRNYFTDSVVEAMRINNRGNVGIGTSSPNFLLDTQRNTNAIIRILDTSTNSSLVLQAGTGAQMKVTGYNYGTSTAVPLYLSVDGANTIMQSGGGNVGIGTTSPSAKLEVNGAVKTAAPTGYSAQPWKLGDATSGTITPNYYIKVEINGQIYSIPALQGTP